MDKITDYVGDLPVNQSNLDAYSKALDRIVQNKKGRSNFWISTFVSTSIWVLGCSLTVFLLGLFTGLGFWANLAIGVFVASVILAIPLLIMLEEMELAKIGFGNFSKKDFKTCKAYRIDTEVDSKSTKVLLISTPEAKVIREKSFGIENEDDAYETAAEWIEEIKPLNHFFNLKYVETLPPKQQDKVLNTKKHREEKKQIEKRKKNFDKNINKIYAQSSNKRTF